MTSSGEHFDAFMALELLGEAVEAFNQGFHHKEKHVTATQLFH